MGGFVGMRGDLLDRLGEKFLVGDDCWLWTASCATNGYGHAWSDGRLRRAHIVIYELMVGPVPEGMELDHLCHSLDLACSGGRTCPHRRCVRPDHLEPVIHLVNCRRGNVGVAAHARAGQPRKRRTHY